LNENVRLELLCGVFGLNIIGDDFFCKEEEEEVSRCSFAFFLGLGFFLEIKFKINIIFF